MEEIITNELIQYKTGFVQGKNDLVELTKLGKYIDINTQETNMPSLWYAYGYQDAISYFSNKLKNHEEINNLRVRDILKTCFAKRVLMHNAKNHEEKPVSTFKL